jgi:hypothetical protein
MMASLKGFDAMLARLGRIRGRKVGSHRIPG